MFTLWYTNHSYPEESKSIRFSSYNQLYNQTPKKNITLKIPFENVLNNTKSGIDILLPLKKNTDFIFTYTSSKIWKFFGITSEDLNGHILKDTLPFLEKIGYKQLMKDIYNEKKDSSNINLTVYDENSKVILNVSQSIFKLGDVVIIITNHISEFLSKEEKEEETYINPLQGMFISQDNVIVQKNKLFEKMEAYPGEYEDAYFNGNIITQDLDNVEWINISYNLVNNKINSYSDQIKWYHPHNSKTEYYLIDAIPITYKNTPCVEYLLIDITERNIKTNQAKEFKENLKIIEKVGKFATIQYDSNKNYLWNKEIYKILEITPKENYEIKFKDFVNNTDYENYKKWEKEFLENPKKGMEYTDLTTIKTAKGNVKYLNGHCVTKYNPQTGKYDTILGFLQDITEIINKENDLKNSLINKEELIEEVHDQVKNSLQLITSLIEIDQHIRNNRKNDEIINKVKERIYTLADIGEIFYIDENFSKINFNKFVDSNIIKLGKILNLDNIDIETHIENINITISTAIPLGIILNELLSNSIKYAFKGKEKGKIIIKFYKLNNTINLEVIDDGIGLPEGLNIKRCRNKSFVMIRKILTLINGSIKDLKPENGTKIQINIPQEEVGD